MYIAVHVQYRLLLSDCNKTLILSTDCTEKFNINFHKNSSNGRRVVLCVETEIEIDGLMDMKKLKIAFSNYTKSSNVQSLNTV